MLQSINQKVGMIFVVYGLVITLGSRCTGVLQDSLLSMGSAFELKIRNVRSA